jgi:hypothetical protein
LNAQGDAGEEHSDDEISGYGGDLSLEKHFHSLVSNVKVVYGDILQSRELL